MKSLRELSREEQNEAHCRQWELHMAWLEREHKKYLAESLKFERTLKFVIWLAVAFFISGLIYSFLAP